MRLGVSVAVVLVVATILTGSALVVTQRGQTITHIQSSGEQSSSSGHLLPAETSSQGQSPVNMTAYTSTHCQTGILESFGVVSTEVSCQTTTTESVGNLTLRLNHDTCYSFPDNYLENSSIASRIFGSFYHTLIYLNNDGTFPTHMSAVYNVTGTQIVQGNWTDGYRMTYTGNELVNVSATLTNSSKYAITHVAHYSLPDRTYTDTYTSQEQKDIQTALSNDTVRADLAGARYYVYGVYRENTVNTTQVDFYQVDGRNQVAANLDDATLKVVEILTGQWGFIGPFDQQVGC